MGRNQQLETLTHVLERIQSTLPGYSITFHRKYLDSIGANAIDVVMQADGMAREFIPINDTRSKEVRFQRLREPLAMDDPRRTYVAPDQRDGFTFDGNYWSPL